MALEGQLLNAQAEGNDHLATELQKRIDKENEALDIMNKFGVSIDDARKKAEQADKNIQKSIESDRNGKKRTRADKNGHKWTFPF